MKKCSYGKKYAENLCPHMESGIKGIYTENAVEYSSEGRVPLGIVVFMKQGKEKHLLNFCPFCGGELLNPSIFGETK